MTLQPSLIKVSEYWVNEKRKIKMKKNNLLDNEGIQKFKSGDVHEGDDSQSLSGTQLIGLK